jgi:serine/threonine-protein kinase RsbW
LKSSDGYKVVASRGYKPDPIGRTLELTGSTTDFLTNSSYETADAVHEIVSGLSLHGHRPFPTLMPLDDPDDPDHSIKGFVMGHGAFVLEQEDLLEMERFLAQINKELAILPHEVTLNDVQVRFEVEGELQIPELKRIELVNHILEKSEPYIVDDDDMFWIRLCLDEAIANAILHGHDEPMDRPVRPVTVKYHIGPGRMVFTVQDSGEGFDHRCVPDPTAEENLLSVSGRGIFLMRKIMDEVVYNERGNQVTMVKYLNGKPMRPFADMEDFNILIS